MSNVYVVNVADAQSISLDIGLRIQREHGPLVIVTCRTPSGFPPAGGDSVTRIPARSWRSPGAVLSLWRILRREQPEIVHLHNGISVLVGAALAKLTGARIVKTEHNDHKFQKRSERIINLLVFPLCDALACNSAATLRSFSPFEAKLAGRRRQVIYNGLDLGLLDRVAAAGETRQELRRSFDLPIDDLVIGTACRFVPQKNLIRLIEGFRQLGDQRRDATLALVGAGPLDDQLRALVARQGMADRVRFLGTRSRLDVYRFMRCLDMVAIPSLWEGFCNAAVEALAMGTPLMAADIETLQEVLGDHAVFVDPQSPAAIAEGIAAIANFSGEERRSRSDKAMAFARAKYTLDITAQRYSALYSNLTGSDSLGCAAG